MSEANKQQNDGAATSATHSTTPNFWWQQLPYVVALVLAIAGVGYPTSRINPWLAIGNF